MLTTCCLRVLHFTLALKRQTALSKWHSHSGASMLCLGPTVTLKSIVGPNTRAVALRSCILILVTPGPQQCKPEVAHAWSAH